MDQFVANDISREISAKHNVPIFPTVREALTRGGSKMAVDGVLLIGEHGDYPLNALGQKLYPRKELFDKIVEVFRAEGHVVPLFCDKHPSWNFDWAQEMIRVVRELRIPFLAGSSLPYSPFAPPLGLPDAAEIEGVVAVYCNGFEPYGFHSLEMAQSAIERRKGGESGIRSVRVHKGDRVWRALDRGEWPAELMQTALSADLDKPQLSEIRKKPVTDDKLASFTVEHGDGVRATHLMLPGHVKEFAIAIRQKGWNQTHAARPALGNADDFYSHFARFNRVIEDMFLSGKTAVPVERTLLTTGAIAAVMQAAQSEGDVFPTPQLPIRYGAELG